MENTIRERGWFWKGIWKMMGDKGKFATLIGLAFSVPANAHFLIAYFNDIVVSSASMENLLWMNAIGFMWFILPSRLTVKGPSIEISIED